MYFPHTDADRETMLQTVGVERLEDLFQDVPPKNRFPDLNLPPALTEMEVLTEMQDLAWTVSPGHFGRSVKAVQPEFGAMGRIGVVAPHPLQELSIRVKAAKAVAEAGVLHSLIRCPATTGHVLVRYVRPGETALHGNGAVAMGLHQALEEPVSEQENVLPAVERFSEAKQFHCVTQGGDHLVDGGVEGPGRINSERSRIACYPLIECCVCGRGTRHRVKFSG